MTKILWHAARARSFPDFLSAGPGSGGILRETPVARIDSAIKLRGEQLAHKLDVRRTQGETAGGKASTEDGLNTVFTE